MLSLNQNFSNLFKIKDFKYTPTHDGIFYRGNLYYKQVKICEFENIGMGGETYIDFINKETKHIFNNLCIQNNVKDTVKKFFSVNYNQTINKINEELIISLLIEDFIILDEIKKTVQKYQTNSICFGVIGEERIEQLVWKKSISSICKSENGKRNIQREIDKLKQSLVGTNKVILNTNLKRLGLNV